MKIGILTFHWATNYGAVLQCYALQTYLESLGHEVEVLNYKPKRFDFSWKKYLYHPLSIRHFRRDSAQNRKENLLAKFRTEYLKLSPRYFTCEDLVNVGSKYDVVISGSDQVLNPSFTMSGERKPTPTYYLNFVKGPTVKIGYAVSFGCTSFPQCAFAKAEQWITNFDKIGVRENTGKDILSSFNYQGEVCVVPDPTILVGKQLFEKLNITRPSIDDYYCVYVLRKNIKVNIDSRIFYIDETNNPISMEEWLGYISHSKGLITNSYHGMIMAILFHIPFVVLLETEGLTGMNDRFITLLDHLGLKDRIISSEKQADSILQNKINWNKVDYESTRYRIIGEEFLNSSCNIPTKY